MPSATVACQFMAVFMRKLMLLNAFVSQNFISSNIIEERDGLIMRAMRKFILGFSVLMVIGIVLATFPQDSQAIPPLQESIRRRVQPVTGQRFQSLMHLEGHFVQMA